MGGLVAHQAPPRIQGQDIEVSLLSYPRALAGVLLKDLLRYRRALSGSDAAYLALCNRNETVTWSPDGAGVRCHWKWGSDLHAPKVLPALGLRLSARAFSDHPVVLATTPREEGAAPTVSFIIGHRGNARLPHLLATIKSIAGQAGAAVECLVVEQDAEPQLVGRLPSWVRHIPAPPPKADMPYSRSWAFNIGAHHARGEVLVLHDNDMLVTSDYAASILLRLRQGHDVVGLKRYIFYMTERHTAAYFEGRASLLDMAPEAITQNLDGGGSVAISRDAYARIGGMDEQFIGWGGEDNEFWERALTQQVWSYGYLPMWHLWHAAQPGKKTNAGRETFLKASAIDPIERIRRLCETGNGDPAGPRGWDGH
jgi:hypothetical protein